MDLDSHFRASAALAAIAHNLVKLQYNTTKTRSKLLPRHLNEIENRVAAIQSILSRSYLKTVTSDELELHGNIYACLLGRYHELNITEEREITMLTENANRIKNY